MRRVAQRSPTMSAVSPGAFVILCERYLPRPSWVIPRSTGTPSVSGTSAKLDRVVLARPDRLAEVLADLLGVDVEGGGELDVADVVAAEVDVHQARDGSRRVGVAVVVDALDERVRAVADADDRDAHLVLLAAAPPLRVEWPLVVLTECHPFSIAAQSPTPRRARGYALAQLGVHVDDALEDRERAQHGEHVDGGREQVEVPERGAAGEDEADREDHDADRARRRCRPCTRRRAPRRGRACRRPSARRARRRRRRRRRARCAGARTSPRPRSARSPPRSGRASSRGTRRTAVPLPDIRE